MQDHLIDSAGVRELGGPPGKPRSHMWVRRLVERGVLDPPKKINGRNFWRLSHVLQRLGLDERDAKRVRGAA
ncbi:MAG: hypothetical protein V2J02_16975 [Pseudomonadales bacterium]|jgi:hypothetical protein|nr:hypothetical protein [Pseudomonadales bacterium]